MWVVPVGATRMWMVRIFSLLITLAIANDFFHHTAFWYDTQWALDHLPMYKVAGWINLDWDFIWSVYWLITGLLSLVVTHAVWRRGAWVYVHVEHVERLSPRTEPHRVVEL
jgi:hypothetical protein